MKKNKNVVNNLLELVGNTPMVKIDNLTRDFSGTFLAKLESANPGHSSKDRIALHIVESAEKKGILKPGDTIIETTSGNTGFSLAMVSLIKGYKCILAVSSKSSSDKIDMLKAMGAKVIAAASSQEKIDLCKKEGADEGIIYERDMDRDLQKKFSDQIKEVTGGGVDMIYDLVGGDYAEPALRAIARHGKYLVIGFTAGIPKMPLNLTLLKECQIVGVFWGQFAGVDQAENQQNFKELFDLHAEGKIKPFVTETYTLDESAAAIKTLEDRKVLGKVVVSME